MSAEEEFRALAQDLIPLEAEAGKIKLRMMQLVTSMGQDIVTKAFPKAKVLTVTPIAQITPSDLAKNARDAVAGMEQHGITPTLIIVDKARCIITLATTA